MSTTKKSISKLLAPGVTSTPGICGGKPCIAGHRIRIMDIYVMHGLQNHTVNEILEDYPSLTQKEVEAGIAYYLNHRGEVEQSYRDEDVIVAELKANMGTRAL